MIVNKRHHADLQKLNTIIAEWNTATDNDKQYVWYEINRTVSVCAYNKLKRNNLIYDKDELYDLITDTTTEILTTRLRHRNEPIRGLYAYCNLFVVGNMYDKKKQFNDKLFSIDEMIDNGTFDICMNNLTYEIV